MTQQSPSGAETREKRIKASSAAARRGRALLFHLDLYQLEHKIVRARNLLSFWLQIKGDTTRSKIFVVGPPRTGTFALHQIFRENGLHSSHTPGIWRMRQFDCFSDRGNFWPFRLMSKVYPKSIFILNTRPVYAYVRSIIHHRFGRGRKSSGWFEPSVRNIQNEILDRNRHYLNVMRYFMDKPNFLIGNIERPGCLEFLCRRLGLEPCEVKNKKRSSWRDKDLHKIERAFTNLGIHQERNEPFLIESLLEPEEIEEKNRFLDTHRDRVFL